MSEPERKDSASGCFVIGPIGDKRAPEGSDERVAFEEGIQVFEEVIEPACEAFGLKPIRADKIDIPGEIPEQAFRHLRDDHVVIADLTGANPNVMYELGLRHTTGKLTFQIGEKGRLPFDISVIRTILFHRSEGGLVEARKKLSQAIAAGLESGGDPVTATRIWFETLAVSDSTGIVHGMRQADEEEEPGYLEKLAEMEASFESNTKVLESIANLTDEIGQITGSITSRLQKVNETGGSFGAKLALVNRLAALLQEPASRMEVLAGQFTNGLARIDPGMIYLLERIKEEEEPSAESLSFRGRVHELTNSALEGLKNTLGFRDAVLKAGEGSRELGRVEKRLAASLQTIADSAVIFERWRSLLQ